MSGIVLGIDPGTRKVGFAVIRDAQSPPLAQGIEPFDSVLERMRALVAAHGVAAVALGRGTNAPGVRRLVEQLGLPIHMIDETETSLRARALYFDDNPPRGWRRLLPRGLLLPPRPIDDYAAVLIARRHFSDGG